MGFFTDLFGGPGDVREIGGGFDPAVRPYIEQGLGGLESAFQEGPRVFEGPRVAGFTDPQLQAQTSLLALSTAQPDYFTTALGDIEEARGLQRQAIAPLTAQDIAAQRQLLEGTAEAQKLAAQQTFEETIRDIGLGAVGGGAGAIEGARADILRGGAAGQLAMTSAQIESQLQQQALQQAEADRAAKERAATGLATLGGQALDVSRTGFGEAQERARLAAGVGAQQQALEQQRIQAELAKFAEADPMAFAQRYLTTVYGAPTRQTQYSQDPSTFQEIMGIATAGAGAAKAMAGAPAKKGGGISSLAIGGTPNPSPRPANTEDFILPGNTIVSGDTGFERGVKDPKTGEEIADKPVEIQEYEPEKTGGLSTIPTEDMAADVKNVDNKVFVLDMAVQRSKQKAARQALNKQLGRRANNGGGIASLQVGGVPNVVSRPNIEEMEKRTEGGITRYYEKPGVFDRVLSGVGAGLKTLGSGIKTGVDFYADKLDPFGSAGLNLTPGQRIRVGLGILAAQPKLGESPLTTVARGAMGPIQQIKAEELARAKQKATLDAARLRAIKDVKPLPNAIFDNINQTIASLYGAKVTRDVTGRVIGIDSSALSDDVAAKMNKELRETIRIAERTYQSDPANIYDKTLTYITENVGPKK